ncbi:probable glutamate receptor, partial [Homarus americanus]
YELVQPSDHIWGGPQPDGSWTGLLGMLQRKDVEFAVGPFGVTPQRETVCDFSHPFFSENNAILMIRPTLQSDMSGFLKPFAMEVWMLTIVSLVTVVLAIALVVKAEANVFNLLSRDTFAQAAMWGVKTLTQE